MTINNTNPGTYLGGTWKQIMKGLVPIGVGSYNGRSFTAGNIVGEYSHELTVNEIPSHNHSTTIGYDTNQNGYVNFTVREAGQRYQKTFTSSSVGGSNSHNNIQPSFPVYFWQRIS